MLEKNWAKLPNSAFKSTWALNIVEKWLAIDKGKWTTDTSGTHTSSPTYLVDCAYQICYCRLQQFLRLLFTYLLNIQEQMIAKLTFQWKSQRSTLAHPLKKYDRTVILSLVIWFRRWWFQMLTIHVHSVHVWHVGIRILESRHCRSIWGISFSATSSGSTRVIPIIMTVVLEFGTACVWSNSFLWHCRLPI